MGTMAIAQINTTQKMVLYRGFRIEEVYEPGEGNVWEWTHEDYRHERRFEQATGICQTVFECIEAVDDWHHHNTSEAAE